MSTLTFVSGDATRPIGEGPKIIIHCCNDLGLWGSGFVVAISRRWTKPENEYRNWARTFEDGDRRLPLGGIQLVQVEDDLFVANIIGQRGVGLDDHGRAPVRYSAIRTGVRKVRARARSHNASVHMPRMGCGLAGGRWEHIEEIIREELVDFGIPVTVYDWAPDAG